MLPLIDARRVKLLIDVRPLVTIVAFACGCDSGTHAWNTRPHDTATAATRPELTVDVRGRFILVSLGGDLPLPYTEDGYRLNCDRLIHGAEMTLESDAWTLRDSVQYRCRPHADEGDSSVVVRDTVEIDSGTLRVTTDTLHFDYYNENAGGIVEVEIGQVSRDTLNTGLGLSGSTPRKYIRPRPS